MAGRISGMGNALSFVDKAQEVIRQEDAKDLQKKIMSAKFDFNDFLKQTRAVARMGSMTQAIGMMPGLGKVTPAQVREAEKSLKVMEAMIEAMTPEERDQPELLPESPARRTRVAQDYGKTEQLVSQLVAQIFQMRVKMKNLMSMMEVGSIPALSNRQDALKAEEKAPPSWYCMEKEEISIKEAVCRVSIIKAKSSWFRVKLNSSRSRKLARLDEYTPKNNLLMDTSPHQTALSSALCDVALES